MKNKMEIDAGDKVSACGYRHQQTLILFICVTVSYSIRACMGVALVAMVEENVIKDGNFAALCEFIKTDNETAVNLNYTQKTETTINGTRINVNANKYLKGDTILSALLLTPPYPRFDWNKKLQDTVLSSFQWGYTIMQIPAGQLAHRFGSRRLMSGAMMISCVVCLILPWAAFYGGLPCTVICRVLLGLCQACFMPGIHTFYGKWAPVQDRGKLTNFAYSGMALGPVLGLPITGFIASSPLGWPGIFRCNGLLAGVLAVILWYVLADTPAKHPKISASERQYIEAIGQKEDIKKNTRTVPWSLILRSRGMYAITAAHVAHTWGHVTLYTEMPAYIARVMNVNIKANGLLMALPFLAMWVVSFFYSWLTDLLIAKKVLSVTHTRKLANSIAYVPAAIGLVVVGYAPRNIYAMETLFVFICVFKVASCVGFYVNHIDISPNFAGTMMSISNCIANGTASLAPLVAGFILTDVSSPALWRQVFFVSAGFYIFSNLVYVVLGTSERAQWDRDPTEYMEEAQSVHEIQPISEPHSVRSGV